MQTLFNFIETLFEKYLTRQKRKKEKKFEVWAKTRIKSKRQIILRSFFYYCLFVIPLMLLIFYFYFDVFNYISFFITIISFIIIGFISSWSGWNEMERNYQQYLKDKTEEERQAKWLSAFMAKK